MVTAKPKPYRAVDASHTDFSPFEGYYQHGNPSSDQISVKGEPGFKARTRGWGVVAGRAK